MILITSGGYVTNEIASEIGLLPPSFLVSGNIRLYLHQVNQLKKFGEKIFLSLPEGFDIQEFDAKFLSDNNVSLIRTDPKCPLGEAIGVCLTFMLPFNEPLRILHGDTLIHDLDAGEVDIFSVGLTDAFYPWAEYRISDDNVVSFIEGLPNGGFAREVLSGYFCFSDPYLFLKSLSVGNRSFIKGLNIYSRNQKLRPVTFGEWLDFGHLQTYYRSKATMTTERHFNCLSITRHEVRKSGENASKIAAEAFWFQNIPQDLSRFTPSLLGVKQQGNSYEYSLEYLYLPTLSELYAFGRLPVFLWENIFAACNEFLHLNLLHKPGEGDSVATQRLYLDKTMERLDRFAKESDISVTKEWKINETNVPSLERIAYLAARNIKEVTESDIGILHGDFCFSNILYDFRHSTIKAIDPRGIDQNGNKCIYGDTRYDIAKLHHSVVGKYDFIKSDMYHLDMHGNNLKLTLRDDQFSKSVENAFLGTILDKTRGEYRSILAASVLLFLSMLPLHADRQDHQWALMANGMRLFKMLEDAE